LAPLPDPRVGAECGLPGYEASTWSAVLASIGTPHDIVERRHGEIVRILAMPEARERISAHGFDIIFNTPDSFFSGLSCWARRMVETATHLVKLFVTQSSGAI